MRSKNISQGMGFFETRVGKEEEVRELNVPLSPSTNFPIGEGFVDMVGRDGGGISAIFECDERRQECNERSGECDEVRML